MNDEFQKAIVELLPTLRRFAFSLSRSLDEADDLVQTACERALSRRAQFECGTRLDSWLYRIVQNAWFDRQRSASRRNHTSDDLVMDALESSDRSLQAMEAQQELDAVVNCMRSMNDDQRVVIALVTIEGKSYREAAEILDVPVGTVMSRLSRGRRQLAEALQRPAQ